MSAVEANGVNEPWDHKPVPIERWGKDHLSTLLYCESRAVDNGGKLDARHLRERSTQYPTRLRDGVALHGHDDYNCIEDMEAAGVVENRGTGLYPVVALTDYGWIVASALRKHRARGGGVAAFVVPAKP